MHDLFLVYFVNISMFRAYVGPSSGGKTVCIQQLVLIILFRRLYVVLVGLDWNNAPSTKHKIHKEMFNFCFRVLTT
jgi:ABC-type transporter Mla maintaining outer membrane lipid asymmetry ATPase subunit MlaF